MKTRFAIAAAVAAIVAPVVAVAPVAAQYRSYPDGYGYGQDRYGRAYPADQRDRDYQGYQGDDRAYRGRDARYYQDCRRSSGTTGAIAGGAGGAILGGVLGGNTLGTLLGAVGGGLLGRQLDKQHDAEQNYRNGC